MQYNLGLNIVQHSETLSDWSQGPIVSPFIGLRAKPGGWREMHTGRNTYLLYCCECKVHALNTSSPLTQKHVVFRIMPKKDCTTEIKSICATHKTHLPVFGQEERLNSVMFASEMHATKQANTTGVQYWLGLSKTTWIGATSRVACSQHTTLWVFCLCILHTFHAHDRRLTKAKSLANHQ